MNILLRTKLKLLVKSGIPGNSTLIDTLEAKYILNLMSEFKALQAYSDSADEEHFDEVEDILKTKIETSKSIN